MIVRALDSNGDWTYGAGKSCYVKDGAAVAQKTKCRLLSIYNDCFFSMTSGIDYFNLLGSKNVPALNLAISGTILNTRGVAKLVQLSVSLDKTFRGFSVSYKEQTIYSTIPISDSLGG